MKILIFEWLTGGGLWSDQVLPDCLDSIQSQGRQMLQAIVEDFLEAGVEIVLPIDGRLLNKIPDPDGLQKFPLWGTDRLAEKLLALAARVDFVMLIAPESGSRLLNCINWFSSCPEKLISPDFAFSDIAANKQYTFEYLGNNGFDSIPHGVNFSEFARQRNVPFGPPMVIKPIDGAGGECVQLVSQWSDLDRIAAASARQYWIEPFISGISVSVSALCGPMGFKCLPPTMQLFDREPFGTYLEAAYPIEPQLAVRATRLAREAMKTLPPTRGYVGLDIVLSDRSERQDCLIEINPRLTMSYLKLREVCTGNLAKLMMEVAGEV